MALRLDLLKILVIEDVDPMRQLLIAILNTLGIGNVLSAPDGEQGFKIFCSENPDIVITDWHMEPMDGIQVTRKIRLSKESPNKTAPVIMLTGFSSIERIHASRDAGVTEYLSKPFTAEKLIKRITHVIDKPRDFIVSPSYFGPDRRRHSQNTYNGPFRRSVDAENFLFVG